ncbi:MAG TPA: NHL repeat-containing protein [Candidatus Kapabacteria bacterium]|jgi:hypothetical protein|nr:NHL repeat-containing protein [Candidatus Kapabacteria bacterium]
MNVSPALSRRVFFKFSWLSIALLLLLAACASGPVTSIPHGENANAEVVITKALRHFTDASAVSLDQFLYLYVLDRGTNSVLKLSPSGDSLRVVSGFGSDHYQFNNPVDIDARLTNAIFIADNLNHRIEQYSKELAYVSTLYTRQNTDPNQRFGYPRAVAVDDAGNIYVADGENKRVLKARSDFSVERTIGGYSEATRPDAILTNPVDLAVDKDQHLIVLDNGGASLVEFDNLGNVLGRIALNEIATAITTSNDTIFALIPSRNAVRLFQSFKSAGSSSALGQEQAGWKIVQSIAIDGSPFTDIATRSGAIYLLTKEAVYACVVRAIVKDSNSIR